MRYFVSLVSCCAVVVSLSAQETAEKPDYTELSKMIRTMALKLAPKEFTAAPAWGLSIPFPPRLRLPNLPRTTIQVGDRVELAHGSWKKAKAWMEEPDKDFVLVVTDLKPLESSKYRLSLTSVAPLLIDYEFQQWLNGIMLVGVNGRAKSKIKIDLDCDVGLSLNVAKFPPEVTVDPKIIATKIDVQDFEVFNPATANRPDRAQNLNNEIKNFAQGFVRDAEPKIQDKANKAIAQALRDGKGTFSAVKLYEAIKK
jgi:hypothetical protein